MKPLFVKAAFFVCLCENNVYSYNDIESFFINLKDFRKDNYNKWNVSSI